MLRDNNNKEEGEKKRKELISRVKNEGKPCWRQAKVFFASTAPRESWGRDQGRGRELERKDEIGGSRDAHQELNFQDESD